MPNFTPKPCPQVHVNAQRLNHSLGQPVPMLDNPPHSYKKMGWKIVTKQQPFPSDMLVTSYYSNELVEISDLRKHTNTEPLAVLH